MVENGSEQQTPVESQSRTLDERIFPSMARILVAQTASKAVQEGKPEVYAALQHTTVIPNGELGEFSDEDTKLELNTFMQMYDVSLEDLNRARKTAGLEPLTSDELK